MGVSGTSTNYADRLLDMHVSGDINPLDSRPQTITYSFGTITKYIAGPQKLVQRYAISLINSGFVERMLGVSNNNVSVAKNMFNKYSWQILKNFRAYQDKHLDQPLDEQLSTAELTSVLLDGDTATFNVKLTTNAGSTVEVLLPLPL